MPGNLPLQFAWVGAAVPFGRQAKCPRIDIEQLRTSHAADYIKGNHGLETITPTDDVFGGLR